ncbi:ATP-binding cassette domain-containing protein [Cryptosporangium japonicum]|uniref:ATP-binding cassette domain-containing protein n=1 Tax=Cryptosporangium japonicum TaxID=80872 RepID=A0ABN0U010_9ACTN
MLVVDQVSKSFGGVRAATDVSLTLPGGAVRCVVGPNGAGKSTFLSMLSGHTRPDSGTIRFHDRDITGWPVHRVARAGIVRKFQRPSFYPELSVAENLLVPVLATGARRRRARAAVEEVAGQVGLTDALGAPAAHLPHGRTQWLEIGMLVARRAEVLLLDEPTAGMTADETSGTSALIARLVADHGVAAIVIEHDMAFVRSLDCPVTVLHLGRVIAEGPMSAVEADEQVRAVYLGEEHS